MLPWGHVSLERKLSILGSFYTGFLKEQVLYGSGNPSLLAKSLNWQLTF